MAKNSIRIKAKINGEKTEVKALIKHEMETGLRINKKTGEKIPPHFIQEVKCAHNGETIFTANWGIAVSKNPYLSFKFTGGVKGDAIVISWVDNKGDSDSRSTKI